MALYSAGAVGVDIRPDTTGFWALLNADLQRRHPEVTIDAGIDLSDVDRDIQRINRKEAEVEVNFKGDTKRIDALMEEIDRKELSPNVDFKNIKKQLDDIDKQMTTSLKNQASWQKYWDKNSTAVKKI